MPFDDQSGVSDPFLNVTGALHDVSNALTVLLGWVSEARAPHATPESRDHALQMIEHRARMARDFARRVIVGRPIADEEDDVNAVVLDVMHAFAVEAHRAGVRLAVARQSPPTRITRTGDVSQILTNLLMNALAYAPRGTNVFVDSAANEQVVTIDVQDEGPGVDPARAKSVFRGDSTREGGTGVGLRHARAVARSAGGDLSLVSVTVQASLRGARFRLTWPRADAPVVAGGVAGGASATGKGAALDGKRVIILEDDAGVAMLLETALGARGAKVTVARTRVDLFKRVGAGTFDAALLDLSPIAGDVKGALDALTKSSPQVSLVFISGSAVGLPDFLAQDQAKDRVRWVRKPFEIAEVVRALTEPRRKT